jgi:2-oxoglutarate dehydrogenase E2 component (dihydrolipoamide succinyltransferase)
MDVIMPQLGETVAEGTVTKWYKKVGDPIKADEVLFDVETDKVSTEIPAPASGVLAEILVQEGATAKVGMRLAVIRESAPRSAGGVSTESTAAPTKAAVPAAVEDRSGSESESPGGLPQKSGSSGRLSPVVSRLIAEHNLDPRAIAGTGRDGRITREDILTHVAQRGAAAKPAAPARAAAPAGGGQEVVPLNNIRKRTAEHVAKAWATVPHVLQVVEADFSRVEEARRAAGAQWKSREGYSLTYLPFVAWAVARALGKFPRLNSQFSGDHLVQHRRVNLGIAVDLNHEGLLVPVVKDAAAKSLPELARAINDLARRARENRLKPDDMTEGTYTISNNGAFGTLITAPIISPPQVAILSTDGVRKRAVVLEGPQGDTIAVRPVGMLAQTFDHRAVDGAYSASFLNEVKSFIETRDWAQDLQ